MIDHKEVEEFILSLPNARRDYPFGEDVAVYKVFIPNKSSVKGSDAGQGSQEERVKRTAGTLSDRQTPADAAMRREHLQDRQLVGEQADVPLGDWKMFALVPEGKEPVNISLKCDPKLSEVLREKYESVMPGYHLNKKHWNTIILSGQLSWEEVQDLILLSYRLVTE